MSRRIDFTTVLTDLDGEPIIEQKVKVLRIITCPHCQGAVDLAEHGEFEEKVIDLREAALQALLDPVKKVQGREGYEYYRLAERIRSRDVIELTDEEVVKLKDLIGDTFKPLHIGRAWDILEPPLED